MFPDQLDIPAIGLEEKIDQVAEEGNSADREVEAGIGRHAEKGAARYIQLRRDRDQIDANQGRERIADAGKQPDDSVKPEPHLRAGNPKAIVKKPGNGVQALHFPVARLRRDNSGRFHHVARPRWARRP
tara:strand:+ start:274 stop:660 length:387 start_codon:yes stop_codon:yes gene_type:complete